MSATAKDIASLLDAWLLNVCDNVTTAALADALLDHGCTAGAAVLRVQTLIAHQTRTREDGAQLVSSATICLPRLLAYAGGRVRLRPAKGGRGRPIRKGKSTVAFRAVQCWVTETKEAKAPGAVTA